MAGENDLELKVTANTAQAVSEIDKLGQTDKSLAALRREATNLALEIDHLEKEIGEAGSATEEQRQKLDGLNREYDETIKKAGAVAAKQDDVKKATAAASASIDGQVRPLNSAGDAFDRLGGKIGKAGGILTAIIVTFNTFYDLTTRLRDKINEFTDGALDRLIQKYIQLNPFIRVIAKVMGVDLTDATEAAIKATDRLGTSVEGQAHFAEKAAEAETKKTEAVKKGAEESEKAAPATDKLAESYKGAAEQADKLADAAKRAADEQAKRANAATQGAQGDLDKIKQRREELAGKDFLSPEELNEQADLVGKQAQAERSLADARQAGSAAALAQAQAQKQVGDATRDALDAANQALTVEIDRQKAIDETADGYGRAVEAIGNLSDGTATLSNVIDDGTVALASQAGQWDLISNKAADFGNVVAGGASDAEGALEQLADTTADTAEKTDNLGDSAKDIGDKTKEGTDKAREEVKLLQADFKDLIALVKEYKTEVANLG